MSLAFSTFSEDWGLQDLCKWYSIHRVFHAPWVTAALKREPLVLWTLEFKISFTSGEVSTVRHCPLVSLWAIDINKTIVAITLKECGHRLFFFFFFFLTKEQTKLLSCGQAQSRSRQDSSLKSLKSLLNLWGPNQLVSFGLLSLGYKFILRPVKLPITQNPNVAVACNASKSSQVS